MKTLGKVAIITVGATGVGNPTALALYLKPSAAQMLAILGHPGLGPRRSPINGLGYFG